MPKNRPVTFFVIDIFLAIEKIKLYTEDINMTQDLIDNDMTFDAPIKQLENIGEAVKHILKFEPYSPFVKKEWRVIADFRNIIVHEYFGIDFLEIFRVLEIELPEFEKEFLNFIKKIKNDHLLHQALNDMKTKFNKTKQINNLNQIKKLEKLLS